MKQFEINILLFHFYFVCFVFVLNPPETSMFDILSYYFTFRLDMHAFFGSASNNTGSLGLGEYNFNSSKGTYISHLNLFCLFEYQASFIQGDFSSHSSQLPLLLLLLLDDDDGDELLISRLSITT